MGGTWKGVLWLLWMTVLQASHSLPTISSSSKPSGLSRPAKSARRQHVYHCQHSCEQNGHATGSGGRGGIQTSTLKSEGNDWSRSIGLLTVASVKTPTWYWGLVIWRNCETRLCAGYGHRNVRFRRSFNYDASKRNNRLRHMPLKQLHIYPQAWAIQTAKTWGQVMGNSNRKLFTLTAFTSAFQMSERCSYDS